MERLYQHNCADASTNVPNRNQLLCGRRSVPSCSSALVLATAGTNVLISSPMNTDLNRIRAYLGEHRRLWTRIAIETGVARRAIAYIVDDPSRDPRVSTVVKLAEWIEKYGAEADQQKAAA